MFVNINALTIDVYLSLNDIESDHLRSSSSKRPLVPLSTRLALLGGGGGRFASGVPDLEVPSRLGADRIPAPSLGLRLLFSANGAVLLGRASNGSGVSNRDGYGEGSIWYPGPGV